MKLFLDRTNDYFKFIQNGILEYEIESIHNNEKTDIENRYNSKGLSRVVTPEQFRNGPDL
ncbi:MAG: hypothetical protein GY756_08270 [bacterium]|nr:hypothetical protein [bacterium]